MGVVEYFERLGLSLNPQLEAQVVGGGVSSSFRRYATIFSSVLIAVPAAVGGFGGWFLYAVKGLPLPVAAVAGVGVAVIAFVLLLALYISLPQLAFNSRAERLERRFMLFASLLASRVYSGMGLAQAFLDMSRGLPRELEVYRLELDYISSLIATGTPVPEALEAAARITPSQTLRGLLLGLAAAARTGTGVEEVLDAAITEYLGVRETDIDRVTNSLGALLEMYMAVAVMLPIALGVVGLLLLFQPVAWLSFDLLLAITTFVLVPVAVIAIVIISDMLISRIKG